MMRHHTESGYGTGWKLVGRGVAALAMLAMVAVGCGTDSTDSGGAAALLSPAEASGDGGEFETFAPPTIEDLTALLSLDAGQVTRMEAALATLQAARDEHPRGRRGGPGMGRSERGGRTGGPGNGRGDLDGPPPRGGRPGGGDPGVGRGGGNPLVVFLESCSGFLDDGQLDLLIETLADLREQHLAGREAGETHLRHGPGFAGGRGLGRFAGEADLGDEQREAMRNAFRTFGDQVRELQDGVRQGNVSPAEVTDGASIALASLESELQNVLGDRILTALVAALDQGRVDFAEHAMDRLGQVSSRGRGEEGLGGILGLDEGQIAAMQAAREAGKPALESLLAQVRDDQVTWPEALGASVGLAEQARTSVVSVLTDAQRARLDSLHSLFPPRGGGVRVPLYF